MLKHLISSLTFLTIFCSCTLLALDGRLFIQKPIFQIFTENSAIIDDFLMDFYRQITPLLEKAIDESEKALFERAYEKYIQEFKDPKSLVIQALREKYEKTFTLSYYTPVLFRHLQQFYLSNFLILAWTEYNKKGHYSLTDESNALTQAQTYINSIRPLEIIDFVMHFEILIKQFSQINDYSFKEQIKDESFFSALIISVIDRATFAEHLYVFPPSILIFLPSHDRNDDTNIDFKFPKVTLVKKSDKEQKVREWIDFVWIFGYPIGLVGYHTWGEPVFDAFHIQAKKALNYKGDLGKIIYPIGCVPGISLTINEISFLNGRTYFSPDPVNNDAVLKDLFNGLVSQFSTSAKIENFLLYAHRINSNIHFIKEPGDDKKTLRWHVLNRFLAQADEKKTSEFFVLLKEKYRNKDTEMLAEEIKRALDEEDKARRNELSKSGSTFPKNGKKKKKNNKHTPPVRTNKSKSAPTNLIKGEKPNKIGQHVPKTPTPKPEQTKKTNRKKQKSHSTSMLPKPVIEDLLPFEGPRLDRPPPIVLGGEKNLEDKFAAKKEEAEKEHFLVEPSPLDTEAKEEAPRPKSNSKLSTIKNGVKRMVAAVKDPSTALQNMSDSLFSDMMGYLMKDVQKIVTQSRKDIEYQKEYNQIVAQMVEAVQLYEDSLVEYENIINEAIRGADVLDVSNFDDHHVSNPKKLELVKYKNNLAEITRILYTYSLPRYGFDLAQMRNFSNYNDLVAMIAHPHALLNLERAQLIHNESNQYGEFREPVIQEANMRLNAIKEHLDTLTLAIQDYKHCPSPSLCPTNDR